MEQEFPYLLMGLYPPSIAPDWGFAADSATSELVIVDNAASQAKMEPAAATTTNSNNKKKRNKKKKKKGKGLPLGPSVAELLTRMGDVEIGEAAQAARRAMRERKQQNKILRKERKKARRETVVSSPFDPCLHHATH